LLALVGLYDVQKGWVQHGLASSAHWLQWQCGTNLAAAREKVRLPRGGEVMDYDYAQSPLQQWE
jgi:hypothetical protein